jgi:tetratricopeptide (TPR) repeat protein
VRRIAATIVLCAFAACGRAQGLGSSPAEQRIAEAERFIVKHPDRADGYNALALALARRARETADTAFYDRAGAALEKSFAAAPANFEGRKTRVWILLGRHEFARAYDEAKALNKETPDDVLVYGYLADAAVELGRYDEAERAVQWMLDLRSGNIPGLTRAAYLRELFGDHEGAIELLQQAYRRTAQAEREDRAWIAVHIAQLELARGRIEPAEKLIAQALELFPDYHYALAALAVLRTQQRRFDEALAARKRHYAAAPHPENLYLVGVAAVKAGRGQEARAAFAEFETAAAAESRGPDNANRELAMYYVDHARAPRKALAIAGPEASRRQDVFTLDALAWSLSATGLHADARAAIDRALAVGVRDAAMLHRAGVIAQRGGDRAAARRHFEASLEVNPRSEVAAAVRRALAGAREPGPKRVAAVAR